MHAPHQSRRQFLVGATLAGLAGFILSGCGRDPAAATPVAAKAPPAPTAPAIRYTSNIAEQKQLAAHISNLRRTAPHDKQKALLLSAYTDPQVLDLLKNLAQGKAAHPTLLKNQFEANPEFGKKVFAVIQDSLNKGLPAIGAVIVELQKAAAVNVRQLPAQLKEAQKKLALSTAEYDRAAATITTTDEQHEKLLKERQYWEAMVRDLQHKSNTAHRSPLASFKVEETSLVKVDGVYGNGSAVAMNKFAARQWLLDSSFPYVRNDGRNDTGIGARTLNALAHYNPQLKLYLRCDEQTLLACSAAGQLAGINRAGR
jgi:hypothetical protein